MAYLGAGYLNCRDQRLVLAWWVEHLDNPVAVGSVKKRHEGWVWAPNNDTMYGVRSEHSEQPDAEPEQGLRASDWDSPDSERFHGR